jgi:hypothetical protein
MPTTGVRFALETALIVATAAVTGFAHLGAWAIVGAVVVVWLATSVFEYSRSHPRSAVSGRSSPGKSSHAIRGPEVEPFVSADDAVERVRVLVGSRQTALDGSLDESVVEVAPGAPPRFELDGVVEDGAGEDSDFEDSVERDDDAEETLVQPSPDSTTVVSVDATVELPAAERVAKVDEEAETESSDEPEPAGDRPGAGSWPDRASAQGAPATNPTPDPESEPVIAAAWSWNVWNLERVVRERAATNEELNFLLLYLRDYANPAGMLPPDFDSLVRESFGDLLAAPS